MEFNPLVPELTVNNLAHSLRFYQRLGFQIEYERRESGFAFLSREGTPLMLEEFHPEGWDVAELVRPFGRWVNVQIEVSDLGLLLEALSTANHPLYRPQQGRWLRIEGEEIGEVEFLAQDPDAYLLRFSRYLGTRPLGENHAQR